ncbi:MAG: hypothetical protein AVDCRST_MAG10-400, partial [uncultured Acidimicrobiales bacterium]
ALRGKGQLVPPASTGQASRRWRVGGLLRHPVPKRVAGSRGGRPLPV